MRVTVRRRWQPLLPADGTAGRFGRGFLLLRRVLALEALIEIFAQARVVQPIGVQNLQRRGQRHSHLC